MHNNLTYVQHTHIQIISPHLTSPPLHPAPIQSNLVDIRIQIGHSNIQGTYLGRGDNVCSGVNRKEENKSLPLSNRLEPSFLASGLIYCCFSERVHFKYTVIIVNYLSLHACLQSNR